MVNYELQYFPTRGLGECARLIFHYAGVEFKDTKMLHDEAFEKNIKPNLTFGQLPVLYVNGKPIFQSNTINRYLAKEFGLAGKDNFEAAKFDEIVDFHTEVYGILSKYLYTKFGFYPGNLDELKPIFTHTVHQKFPIYVKLLKESRSGFFGKSGVSWVDFLLANFFKTIQINEPEVLGSYPELEEFKDRVLSLPQIKEYVKNREYSFF